ncbi:UNVERIFIED_CONTAM: hypothetical protein GTU68_035099 [Idotea baltica]|jgi:hypothetical protein
MRPT